MIEGINKPSKTIIVKKNCKINLKLDLIGLLGLIGSAKFLLSEMNESKFEASN
jgi:hypothetical protein